MKEFLENLISTWWGILIICLVCVAVWILLSALLYRQFFKRFYDIVLSVMAIIVFSPLLLLLIIVGAIKMKGNPFFTQLRPGRRKKLSKKQCLKQNVPYGTYGKEKIFKLIKFRTMTCEKDENGQLLPDEKRLTKYGKFLRGTSLDELPELFNIFVGHMSIVGPRPLLVKDMVFMSEEQRNRHNVRQGLTGLAQVNGRNTISWEDKLNYDLKYINHINLFIDLIILCKTVLKVLNRSDINREGTASDMDYGGWLLKENKITEEEYAFNIESATELLKKCKK